MQNVSKKLLQARKQIATTPIKKQGRNEYSKYDYFTPSQVSELVTKACQEFNLLTQYSLENTEFGFHGKLVVTDIDSGEHLTFTMATAMPEITATNSSQKLGGMATFNERYLKMSVFEIVDNNLDFDAHDNRDDNKQPTKQQPQKTSASGKQLVSDAMFENMLEAIANGNGSDVKAKIPNYQFNAAQQQILRSKLKGVK